MLRFARRTTRLAAVFGLFLSSQALNATTLFHDQLESALQDAKSKEYDRAIGKARKLLDSLALNTVEDIILAHKVLGVSYCEIGDQTKAAEHFEALVTFSPNETLEGLARTKPCTELYKGIQTAANPPKESPKKPTPAATPIPPPAAQPAPIVNETTPGMWRRYVPFGTGQFANRQPTKGWVFLSTEAVAVAAGLSGFLLFKSEEGSGGVFKNPDRASFYRGMVWGAIGLGSAAAIWGIVDAVIVFRRQTEKQADRRWEFDGTRLALSF